MSVIINTWSLSDYPIIAILEGVKRYFVVVFKNIFLMTGSVKHLSIYLLIISVSVWDVTCY